MGDRAKSVVELSKQTSLNMASGYTCRQCLRIVPRVRNNGLDQWYRGARLANARLPMIWGRNHSNNSRRNHVLNTGSSRSVQTSASKQASAAQTQQQTQTQRVLRSDNLFHPYSQSPSPHIRQRAAFMMQNALCPHPSHRPSRQSTSPHDSEARKDPNSSTLPPAHARFECPDCGVPVYCSEEHWADDYEKHLEVCDTLRQINEDDHDLVSGRFFPEFASYPGPQDDNFVVNMTNWDTFLYTREFPAINDERSMRQVTRLLTYPVTIASVLHELSPYHIRKGGRLTVEGLKSLSGIILLSESLRGRIN